MKNIFTLILLFAFSTPIFSQTEFIDDKLYGGLAYISKLGEPNLGFILGATRYYSKYNISILGEGGIDLYFEENESSRYREETFSNGQTRCRDTQNGQFADSSKCSAFITNPTIRLNGLVNYHFNLDESMDFFIGTGFVISNVSTPIVSLGLTTKPMKSGFRTGLGFGKDYFYAGGAWLF